MPNNVGFLVTYAILTLRRGLQCSASGPRESCNWHSSDVFLSCTGTVIRQN